MDSAEEAPSHKGGDESPSSASQQETSLANAENASSSDSTLNEKPTGSHSNNHGDGSLDAAGKCDTQNPSAESGARTECSVEDSVKRTESSKQSATRTEAENASEPVQDPGGCTEKIDSITSDKASDERSESERPKMRCIDNESPRAQDPVIALDNCTPDLPPDLKEVTGGTGCDDIDTSGTTQAVSKDKESEDNTNTDKVVNEEENMDLHKCIEEKMGSLPNDECNSAQASVRTETDAGSNKCLTEENCINEDEEVDNQEYGGTSYSSKNPENSISDKSSDHSRSSPSTDCIQPETSHNVNLGEPEISSKSEGERAAISRNAECDGANGSDKADGDSPGGRGKGDRDEPDISGKVDSEKVDCDGPGDSERADRDGPGDSEKAGRYGLGDSEKADRDRPDGSGKADSEGPDGSGKADSEGPDGSGKADCDVINGSGKVDHHGTKRGGNPERESHGNSVMAECEGLENSPNVDCAEPEGGVEQLYAPVTQMTAHSDRGDFSMVTVDDPSFETAKVTEEGNGKANASKSVLESSETVVSREEAMEVDSGEDDVPSVNKDQVPYPEGGIEDDTTDANSRGSINADTSDAVGISKDSNNQESELMDTSEPHIEETGIPSSCEEEKEDSKSPAAEDTCRKDHPSTHSEPDDSSPSSRESDSLDCRSKDIAETRQPETKPSVDKTVEEVLVVEEETTNPRKEASAADGVDLNSACEDELVDSASSREENDLFQLNRDTEGQMDVDESQQDEAGTEMATEDQEKHVSKEVDKQEDSNEIGESTGEDKEGESNDAEGNNKHKEDKVGEKVVSSKLILGVSEGETIIADETGGNEVEEDLCIVPDTEPRIPTDKEKAEAVEKAGKTATECSPESSKGTGEEVCVPVESVTAKRRASIEKSKPSETVAPASTQEGITRTPEPMRRPQRQAAQKADAQIKVCLAAVDSQKDDEDVVVQEGEKEDHTCCNCGAKPCRYRVNFKDCAYYLCKEECVNIFKKKQSNSGRVSPPTTSVVKARELDRSFVRKCGQCNSEINANDDKVLTWETMDFCNEDCLGKHQTDLGSHCANCKGSVQAPSLGKYCVRFGYDIKQFCCASCLEEFKKGLKVCSYCQKDISNGVEGFLAPVGDKGQFKDFCTQACMEKYEQMSNNTAPPETANECAVCNNVKVVKVEVVVDSKVQQLCSEPCFAAFKFVNAIVADQCDMCKKYFDKAKTDNFTVFYDDAPHSFCCKTCMNVYILAKRKIVPCVWCKVKKYNFDMIKKVTSTAQVLMMCSLNCLTLYHVSVNCATNRRMKCDKCNLTLPAQYHLTMSDATIRNFCSYNCVMNFQGQYTKCPITLPGHEQGPHPTGGPKKALPRRSLPVAEKDLGGKGTSMPVISSVTSLAPANGQPTSTTNSGTQVITAAAVKRGRPRKGLQGSSQQGVSQPQSDMSSQDQNNDFGNQTVSTENIKSLIKQQLIIKPPQPPPRQNRAVQVKPIMHTKGVSCRPHPCTKETQTEEDAGKPVLIPIPVPIFIPAPMHMYSSPYPVPIPFPLPIPVPIFIPTTRNSAKGIFKEIKRIQEKIPTDPFEAELLMMAEMVAGEKKAENTDTESEDGDVVADEAGPVASSEEPDFTPEAVDTSNTFGDDIMQMALKMASELDEPAVDFEAAVVPATITQTTPAPQIDQNDESEVDDPEPNDGRPKTGRKRPLRSTTRPPSVVPKRSRRVSGSDAMNVVPSESAPTRIEPTEKPDANMCLKFTFGVNAWKHWVSQKNAELEKAASNTRKLKLFKPEILQLTADELNYSLCLFVKEVRKPNGSEYAPDTIYYLCLGIQQYLIENGRVENIFSDPYYEKFTECLDDVAKKFSVLYNDAQYVVTRVEEEHLWESKQLGAHSPHVLLSTLMFFNTKHFNLTTVDEHMQLSFSHIMKHWKRNPNSPGAPKLPGSRNVLLRFYPPQSSLAANARKKKVYEQQENEDNPLRCPVKLYEFYLSKCPESVKTRNDVFYLLPERSCVPDSPVWYSTMALGKEQLQKMLHRIKMVKEINIALLSS